MSASRAAIAKIRAVISKARERFPWGRIKPRSNGKNGDLKSTYEKNSRRAERFAFLILIGLAVEIVEVFVLQRPLLEASFTIGSTLLILLGVWGEILFERRAREAGDGMIAEANARASEANERAARAELDLAKYRAWRRLEGDAFASVVAAMKPFAGTPYTLAFSIAQPEITELMFQINAALSAAGLEQQGWPQTNAVRFPAGENAVTPGIGAGVNVRDVTITWALEPGVPPPLARVGQTLSNALNAIGIVAGGWGERQAPMTRPNPTLRVMVGLKA